MGERESDGKWGMGNGRVAGLEGLLKVNVGGEAKDTVTASFVHRLDPTLPPCLDSREG